jgi:hypothetical protein
MRTLFAPVLSAVLLAAIATTASAASSQQVTSLRRLTQAEYRNSVADIFGPEIEVRGSFEPTLRIAGLQAASTSTLSVTPVGFESFTQMADSIATQVVSEKLRAKLPCKPKDAKAPDDTCSRQVLDHYGMMLFRRPLTDSELKNAVNLSAKLGKSQNDFYAGLRYGLASLIQAPDFLFRKEVAVPAADKTWTIEPYSRATRLSYLLWNTAPDAGLLAAAKNGDLNTAAGLDKQVTRLMTSPRLDVGMRAFFNDMLELDTFDTVSKDSILYPKWSSTIAASAKEETLRTAVGLALHDNGDMRELMTTRKTYINRALAADYRLAFPFKGDWVAYEFPADAGRSGVLTQASMLAMFSHPGRSSPTKRGVALMDIFLCEPTPAPPANVDFSAVNDPTGPLTVRQRLMAHASNAACASCHTHSDPIGLSLEGFDTIGGVRSEEKGKPIDVSATIQGKSFAGAIGLGKFLHDNPKYPACVARKMFAYSKGVNSEDVTAASFKAGRTAFIESGYHLRSLIKGLVEDPAYFSADAPEPAATKVAASK